MNKVRKGNGGSVTCLKYIAIAKLWNPTLTDSEGSFAIDSLGLDIHSGYPPLVLSSVGLDVIQRDLSMATCLE